MEDNKVYIAKEGYRYFVLSVSPVMRDAIADVNLQGLQAALIIEDFGLKYPKAGYNHPGKFMCEIDGNEIILAAGNRIIHLPSPNFGAFLITYRRILSECKQKKKIDLEEKTRMAVEQTPNTLDWSFVPNYVKKKFEAEHGIKAEVAPKMKFIDGELRMLLYNEPHRKISYVPY